MIYTVEAYENSELVEGVQVNATGANLAVLDALQDVNLHFYAGRVFKVWSAERPVIWFKMTVNGELRVIPGAPCSAE